MSRLVRVGRCPFTLAASLLGVTLASCSAGTATATGAAPLSGTTWELVSIQSMDDAIGTTTIADPARYTVSFGADGKAAFRLDCNRGRGTWEAKAAAADSGQLQFGPIAATHALCPPPSVGVRVARDMAYVRSYLLRDGRLHMSLFADGGIYSWRPSKP